MCVNDAALMDEAIYYLNRLKVPEGYVTDLLTIEGAPSMAEGYNEGMRSSDARYKIYLHQDVFIIDRRFLHRIIEIFKDETIGMIGPVGYKKLPKNGIQVTADITGAYITNDLFSTKSKCNTSKAENCIDVKSIDGFLMATQYDLPWREDIFKDWDFYDVSQSFEFRKKGYRVVVPAVDKPGVIHYDGLLNMKDYYKNRRLFLENYGDTYQLF